MSNDRIQLDTPETEDWIKRHKPGAIPPADPGALQIGEQILAEEERAGLLKHRVTKGLSPAFGSKRQRRNQLVARLKRARGYKPPVRGGRGKRRKI